MLTGLVSVTFRKLSCSEIVDLVQKAGLQAIEWGGDIHVPAGDLNRAKEVRQMTDDAGLQSLCYGSYFRLGDSEAKGLSFATVLETAAALGAPSIRVWPGTKGSAEVKQEDRYRLAAEAHSIAELASRHKITVCFEFHANTLTDTLESAQTLLAASAHPHLKTLWQPPNGMDPHLSAIGLETLLPLIHHLHVFHWWPTAAERRPLSDGAANWKRYLDVLRQNQRPLPLLIEFVRGDEPDQFLADAAALKSWLA